jgi:HK97 family phage major capsid protein
MAIEMISRTNADPLIPEPVTAEIINSTVADSAVLSAGRRLPNMTSKTQSINVLDMLPMAYWVDGDTGIKQTSHAEWERKKLYAEEIAVIIPIPEAVLDDSSYNIWGEIQPRIAEAFGKKIDEAILFGVNKPTSFRDSILTTATTAGAVVTQSKDVYKDIMGTSGVIAKVEDSGYLPTGALSAVKMRAALRELTDSNGRPLFKTDMQGSTPYAIDGVPMTFPVNGAFDPTKALMIIGDFTQLVYSIRQDINYKVLTEATIIDPSTKEIVYALAQQDMVALRATMRMGWEIPNPVNAFQSDKTKRCPFAVYAPSAS